MSPPQSRPTRLLSAVLGIVCGGLVSGSLFALRMPTKTEPSPDTNANSSIAKPATLTATPSAKGASPGERDLATVDAILKAHPDAVPLPREGAVALLGMELSPLIDLAVGEFAVEVLDLTPEENESLEQIRAKAYQSLQALEVTGARVTVNSDTEIAIDIDPNPPDRLQILRGVRREFRELLGPLRGNIAADAQEQSLLLGRPELARKMSLVKSTEVSGVIEWNFRGTSEEDGADLSTSSTAVTLKASDFTLLDHLVDLETWSAKEEVHAR